MNHPLTMWVGAIITLTVLSYLIKDNVFYRILQKAAMGTGVGIGIIMTWEQVLKPYWWDPITKASGSGADHSGLLWLLVLIPGLMWYCQMSKKWFWVSQPIIGLFIGVAAGLAFKNNILLLLPQITAVINKTVNPFANGVLTQESSLLALNNMIFLIALFTSLLYFCFTIKADNRIFHVPLKISRVTIMVALGAMFGSTIMTRMSFLIERIQFLRQFFTEQFVRLFN